MQNTKSLKSDFFPICGTALGDAESHTVAVSDFLNDTKKFLDENYRGCYTAPQATGGGGVIMIRTEGYAELLKSIFNTVFAKHLISISPSIDETQLHFVIGLNTASIDDSVKLDLVKLATSSGFSIEITDADITLSFRLLDASFSAFQSVSPMFVYNMLKKAFAS